MAELKRQRSDSFDTYDDDKRTQLENTCLQGNLGTKFEDLANEILHEIFEYLEHYHVYKAFFKLNTRYNDVLTKSTLPIQLKLSSMTKVSFEQYRTDIIKPCKNRVNFVGISNPCIYDQAFAFLDELSTFPRLEMLVLHDIQADDLGIAFLQLISLSHLSSLVISCVGPPNNQDTLYLHLFRLPVLKYCKISFKQCMPNSLLPRTGDEYSPIEHLIVNEYIDDDELDRVLTYVPRLRRLSIGFIIPSWKSRTNTYIPMLEHLKDVSLRFSRMRMNAIFSIIANYCRTVEVLRVSIQDNIDGECVNENRWKQLITSHLPNLRVFNVQIN